MNELQKIQPQSQKMTMFKQLPQKDNFMQNITNMFTV